MSSIDVYAFEGEDGESATEWTTFDLAEAREYAQANGYALIAREYEYSDSSLVEDYRPGHALDGTPLED
jgi:hypothetical protein